MPGKDPHGGHGGHGVRPILPSSLTGRLVLTAVALVTLVSVLIALGTAVAMRSYLIGQLDTEVRESASRAVRGFSEHGLPFDDDEPRPRSPRGFGEPLGQGSGTITVVIGANGSTGQVITSAGAVRSLTDSALAAFNDVPADGHPHGVDVPGVGDYRVVATALDDGTVVTGLPIRRVERTVSSLVRWALMCTLAGLVAAGAAALILVRRQLRPLREVARTAHEVASLPLSKGEIGMTARVPERLTDERTEVGQVGAALNTMLGHVEEALDTRYRSEQQIRQFVADASHELRTPLATIQGYAELSRRPAAVDQPGSGRTTGAAPGTDPHTDTERLLHAMGKVEAEASRMSSLVEDLLLLARLDAGRPLARDQVDLTRLVLESVGDARVVAPGHRWKLELGEEPVVVVGDEHRLHQAITNLLNNARRHTPAGTTVTVGVRLAGDIRTGAAVVTVHDNGPGIPEGLRDSVFERFSRGDSARTRASGGVGLGLSLVKAITDAHGGDIRVDSRPGSTTFTLTLPAPPAVSTPPAPSAPPVGPVGSASPVRPTPPTPPGPSGPSGPSDAHS